MSHHPANALLGRLLTDPLELHAIMRMRLAVEDFEAAEQRAIWLCANSLFERGEPVDVLIVYEESRRVGLTLDPSRLTGMANGCAGDERPTVMLADMMVARHIRLARPPGLAEIMDEIAAGRPDLTELNGGSPPGAEEPGAEDRPPTDES